MHKLAKVIIAALVLLVGGALILRYYHKTANLANFPVIETDPSSLIVQIYAAKFPTSQDYSVSDRKQIGHGIYLPQYEYVLTNKHVLAETGYNYRLDPEDKQAELINIRYHPAQDLALAKLISSIETGGAVYVSNAQLASGQSLYYYENTSKKSCQISDKFSDETITTPTCRFYPGQSGLPVFDEADELLGIITASSDSTGYISTISARYLSAWVADIAFGD